jgi:hypothetical protein
LIIDFEDGKVPKELASKAYLDLLCYLRVVGLQDYVYMQQAFPAHFVFHTNPMFKSDSWKRWCKDVLATACEAVDPFDETIKAIAPMLASSLGKVADLWTRKHAWRYSL